MRKSKEYSIVYTIGSIGYGFVELLWRGFTHWSMLLTGGACMLSLYVLNFRHFSMRFWKKCLLGTGIITLTEFVVGFIVNRVLRLNVWDYSRKRGNICGQICLQYSFLWFLLCVPVLFLCRYLKKCFFKW